MNRTKNSNIRSPTPPRAPRDDERAQDSEVSVSISWKKGGWALAILVALFVLARILGFI